MKARTLPLTLKSDNHQISPYNITPESNIKVTRIKEMITNQRLLKEILLVSTLYSVENSMENINIDDRAQRVEAHLINLLLCHHRQR